MMLRGNATLTPDEKKALRLLRALGEEQRETLMAFMEFLAARGQKAAPPEPARPQDIPRPEAESVVKALKRLRATYPMLDQNKLFGPASEHMTSHLMHGKPAAQVIDELEQLFLESYRRYLDEAGARQDSSHNASEA